MTTAVSLGTIRDAITSQNRAQFVYDRQVSVTADIYLLGHARKTAAYIVVAWCIEPAWGWRILRYSEIRDFVVLGPMDMMRPDFDPRHREIMSIDTWIMSRP